MTGGDTAARAGRLVATGILALLLVAGFLTIEAWPLTGWRLFSAARGDSQTRWEIDAVVAGEAVAVDLDDLPITVRHAEWPLARLRRASGERREEVCQALLRVVRAEIDGVDGVRIVQDDLRLVERDEGLVIASDRQPVHECE